jgi:wyosine [tRNA(Phe)-imidazoG37] synthetase (radical SAM superfamily)
MQIEREVFNDMEVVAKKVRSRIRQVKENGVPIDYLTFVSDGEPTLDFNLGAEIELLKPLGIRIGVITNASLLWRQDVRNDLKNADWVSLKVDTVSKDIWKKINRPHRHLELETILDSMFEFANNYKGEIATESMLIQGFNDSEEEIHKLARLISKLQPHKAYLAIPTRPPANRMVTGSSEYVVNMAYQIFSKKLDSVECMMHYEGNNFRFASEIEKDLLDITSVHPMREEAVIEFLRKANTEWRIIENLINKGALMELRYQGSKFYMKRLPDSSSPSPTD